MHNSEQRFDEIRKAIKNSNPAIEPDSMMRSSGNSRNTNTSLLEKQYNILLNHVEMAQKTNLLILDSNAELKNQITELKNENTKFAESLEITERKLANLERFNEELEKKISDQQDKLNIVKEESQNSIKTAKKASQKATIAIVIAVAALAYLFY